MRLICWQLIRLMVAALLVSFVSATATAAEVKLRHRFSVYADGQQQSLNLPEGIASISPSGAVVADTGNNRLLRCESGDDAAWRVVSVIELAPSVYATKIQVRRDGEILVLDRKQMRVFRLGPDGEMRGPVFTRSGTDEPVKSFALDGKDNLYLMGYTSGRIRMVGPDGSLRREISPPADGALLLDLTVDRNGRVLAVDAVDGVVFAAGPVEATLTPITGSLKQYARFPSRITTDQRGRIYLSDRNGCRIIVLGPDGSFLASLSARGLKEGLLQYPAQISASGDTLFVADTLNHRIQVFTLSE